MIPASLRYAVSESTAEGAIMRCSVCGGGSFTQHPILWDSLIKEWQLAPQEAQYVDRQQGEKCNTCGANLRSIALASAILAHLQLALTLQQACDQAERMQLLEINEAGSLTKTLRRFPGYTFGAYPDVDIHRLPFADASFDIVVHSDTLEHVANPVHALSECRRVLKTGGAICFTVPIILGRLSRDRSGLPPSYHGNPSRQADDLLVRTEFGADAWVYVMEAGFTDLSLHACEFPAAIAIRATK
jgi:SAM-dependent methyltransferase